MRFIRRDKQAWRVRIQRGGYGVAMYFSDADYGGTEASLKKAKKYRDVQERRTRKFLKVSSEGRTLIQKWGDRFVVMAHIHINKARHSTSFGILKYGTAGAQRMADEWLAKKREEKKKFLKNT